MYEDETPDENGFTGPSKSQIKREDEVLQLLARRLLNMPKALIAEFPVPEVVRDALYEGKRISSNEALRRHMKRVTKLIRELDTEAVALAMDRVDPNSSLSMSATRTAQRWCDRLMKHGNEGLTDFLDQHSEVDVQRLRQMVRKAEKDSQIDADKPSLAVRDLMKFVRQIVIRCAPPIATERLPESDDSEE